MSDTTIDWFAIERDYRSGILSVFQLAKLHGIPAADIRSHARERGWVQADLSSETTTRAAELLAEGADVVEAAATKMAKVLTTHRNDLGRLRGLVKRSYEGLSRILSAEPLQPGDEHLINTRTSSAVDALDKLAAAATKLIALERQAFSLDESSNPNPEAVRATVEAAKTELVRRGLPAAPSKR